MNEFDWQNCLHKLKHYLPSQAHLKDFIHHNTLHGFKGNYRWKRHLPWAGCENNGNLKKDLIFAEIALG